MASSKIKIRNYILGETLGVGSFGKVKVAIHEQTGRKVGVKILNRKKIASLDMAQKIRREIQVLKLLRHPHIIKLYEVINTPTDIFMIMEYVSGGELFDYIVKNGKMQENEARRIFQQIICAVEYCHRHKIVHRDLKPENLLLDTSNGGIRVKIADFGLSNIMEDGEFLKTSCGSPNYAAPEVISAKLYAGAEIDVWSCGVILYALLCGRLPFDGENVSILYRKIKGGIFTIPPYVSPAARDLLVSMLVVDPMRRISIQEIRANEWFNVDLPNYLRPLPEAEEDKLNRIEPGVVKELVDKLHMTEADIDASLHEDGDNPVKVAYSILLDNQKIEEEGIGISGGGGGSGSGSGGDDGIDNIASSLPGSLPTSFYPAYSLPSSTPVDIAQPQQQQQQAEPGSSYSASSISKLSFSYRASMDGSGGGASGVVFGGGGGGSSSGVLSKDAVAKKRKRSRWHLGIRSFSRPFEIMGEVYIAMRNLGMDWKVKDSPYHVIGRYHFSDGDRKVLISLQLYKVDDRSYLLDFLHVDDGNRMAYVFDFFTVCSKLITELAISG